MLLHSPRVGVGVASRTSYASAFQGGLSGAQPGGFLPDYVRQRLKSRGGFLRMCFSQDKTGGFRSTTGVKDNFLNSLLDEDSRSSLSKLSISSLNYRMNPANFAKLRVLG